MNDNYLYSQMTGLMSLRILSIKLIYQIEQSDWEADLKKQEAGHLFKGLVLSSHGERQ